MPRSAHRSPVFLLLAIVLAVSGQAYLIASAQAAPQGSQFGDIELLLSEAERSEFAGLSSEAARTLWIEAFWERMDPTPGTDTNELRAIWQQRIARADEHYGGSGIAGHRTDRGRVLTVLGLPDEIEARAPDGGPASSEVWTYGRGAFQGTVTFDREGARYALRTQLPLSARAFVESADEELRLVLAARFAAGETPSAAPATAAGPDVAATPSPAESLAPEVRIWMQLVMGGQPRSDLDLRSNLGAFPAAEGTYTTIAFELAAEGLSFAEPVSEDDESEGGAPEAAEAQGVERAEVGAEAAAEIAASIERDAAAELEGAMDVGPVARLKIFGAFLQGEPGSENTIHQFIVPATVAEEDLVDGYTPLMSLGVTLAPGRYRLAWGVMDEATEMAVTRDGTVEIPDFSGAMLQITEPLLARPPHLQATEPMSTQEVYEGVRLGDVLIRDQLDRTFARDAVVEVVTVVTGWQSDPNQPGRPLLEVEYRILRADEAVSLARIPVQSLDFHVLGQQIPLGQIARIRAGEEYRIHIRVKDLVGGAETERLVPIRIGEPTEPPIEPTR